MAKNEKTSKEVAKVAARLLRHLQGWDKQDAILVSHGSRVRVLGTVGELKAVAASALTQTPDKPRK